MENIEKNILAALIVIATTYILLVILFRLDNAIERYILLGCYVLVLILGLLRPDLEIGHASHEFSLNPFGFLLDIVDDEASWFVMIINMIIFSPSYFLLSYTCKIKNFWSKLLIFEGFALLIEISQYFLDVGIADLSDMVLYNVGFFAGFVISLPILKFLNRGFNKRIERM